MSFNVKQVTSPLQLVPHIAKLAKQVGSAAETAYFNKNVKREPITIRWVNNPARPAHNLTSAHQDQSPAASVLQDTGWTQARQRLTATHHAPNVQADSSAQLAKVLQTLALRELSPTQAQPNVIHALLATTAQRRPTFQSLTPTQTSAQVE